MNFYDYIYEQSGLSKSARNGILEAFNNFENSLASFKELVTGDGERASNNDVNKYVSIILSPKLDKLRKEINKQLK